MEEIVSYISSVGFPIVMCLVIMYYWNNQYTTTIESLKDTISQLATVVQANTLAITKLEAYFGKDDEDESNT